MQVVLCSFIFLTSTCWKIQLSSCPCMASKKLTKRTYIAILSLRTSIDIKPKTIETLSESGFLKFCWWILGSHERWALITKEKIVELVSVTVSDLGSNVIKEHSQVCFKIKSEEASQKIQKAAHILYTKSR
jgi:hypothetical protein